MPEKKNRFLNVWDDTVGGKDLLLALCISTPLTLGGYLLRRSLRYRLFWD